MADMIVKLKKDQSIPFLTTGNGIYFGDITIKNVIFPYFMSGVLSGLFGKTFNVLMAVISKCCIVAMVIACVGGVSLVTAFKE